jgi:TRAP-type C4-dicarboxylate transport system substrate-binding protein
LLSNCATVNQALSKEGDIMRIPVAAAAVVLLAAAAGASADTIKLSIGAGYPLTASWQGPVKTFFIPRLTERVKKETGHTLVWTEAWGGSVCKPGECLEAVESGLLDVADVLAATEPAKLMAHNFSFFVPFGSPDPRVVAKAAQEVYDKTPALKTVLESRYKQVFLGVGVTSNYGLVTTFKWKDFGELKGRKIAAVGPNMPWMQGSGVTGVQSNLNEAYTSLQTGVYDGWIVFADAVVSFKLTEITKQYVDMDFGAASTPLLTMNANTWKSLPANVQKIFLEVGREWNKNMGAVAYEKQEATIKRMKEVGFDVRQADFATKQAWAKGLPNIPKQRFDEINKAGMPGEVVYTYIKALKAAGHKFPRDWEAER